MKDSTKNCTGQGFSERRLLQRENNNFQTNQKLPHSYNFGAPDFDYTTGSKHQKRAK
jgi:hypothetical protein